jgi:hypothetical protein
MWILKNSKDLLDNLKSSSDSLPEGMFKEVMNDLWLARISSSSNEVGLYVALPEVLLLKSARMPIKRLVASAETSSVKKKVRNLYLGHME